MLGTSQPYIMSMRHTGQPYTKHQEARIRKDMILFEAEHSSSYLRIGVDLELQWCPTENNGGLGEETSFFVSHSGTTVLEGDLQYC